MSTNLKKQFEELEKLVYLGKYKAAIKVITKLEKNNTLNESYQLNLQYIKAQTLYGIGNYRDALELTNLLHYKSKKADNHLMELNALLVKSSILWRIGQLKEALALVNESEQIIDKSAQLSNINIDFQLGMLKLLKGANLMYLGQITESIKFYNEAKSIAKKLQNKLLLGYCLNLLTIANYESMKPKQGIKYGKEALAIFEEIGNQQEIGTVLNALSMNYSSIGDLKEGEKCLRRAIEIAKKSGINRDMPYFLHNLAANLKLRGELDLALEFFKNSYEMQIESEGLLQESRPLTHIGSIYHVKGNFKKAFEYYQKSQKIREASDNKPDIVYGLILLLTLALDMGNIDEAKQFLEQIRLIADKEDVANIKQNFRLGEALILKTSTRVRDKGKAEEIFVEFAEKEHIFHKLKKIALINLCELLINELRISGNPDILSEIKTYIKKLLKFAETYNSYLLFAEVYWLQAQMALIDLDVKKAEKLLKKALKISEEKGLNLLEKEIVKEQKKLEDQFDLWKKLSKQKAPVFETLQHINPEETVKRMQREATTDTSQAKTAIIKTKLFSIKI